MIADADSHDGGGSTERAKGGSLRLLAVIPIMAVGLGFAYWRHLYCGVQCSGEDITLPMLKAVGPALAMFLVGAWTVLGAREPAWRWFGMAVVTGASLVALMLGMPKMVGCMLTP